MIYFVQSPAGPINIGTSISRRRRLAALTAQFGAGLELVGVVDGSYPEERALRERFAHFHVVGEWFDPAADLWEFLADQSKVTRIPA